MFRLLDTLIFRLQYGFACLQADLYLLTPNQRAIVFRLTGLCFFLLAGDDCSGGVPHPCEGAACIQHNVSTMGPTPTQ